MTRIYVTKYALTEGVTVHEAEIDKEMAVVRPKGNLGLPSYFHRGEWFESGSDAIDNAEDRRAKAIEAAHRKIKKLNDLTFKVPA